MQGHWSCRRTCPTRPFPIIEPQNPGMDEIYVVQERRATDFKDPKLWKGSSGGSLKMLGGTESC